VKTCSSCKESKTLDSFYKQKTGKDGLRAICKLCEKEIKSTWNKENPGKRRERTYRWRKLNPDKEKAHNAAWYRANVEKAREKHLMRTYGLTLVQFDSMLEKQDYKCAICHIPNNDLENNICVDHDAETGKVRGLLCPPCNQGLGLFKDSEAALMNAAAYISTSKSTVADSD